MFEILLEKAQYLLGFLAHHVNELWNWLWTEIPFVNDTTIHAIDLVGPSMIVAWLGVRIVAAIIT